MDRQWHKLIILILLLLFPVSANALQPWLIGAGTPVSTDCPEGTYLFAWNGDYPSDTDKGCFTNGTVQKDGTQSGGTLNSTAFTKTAHNQYVLWVVATDDGLNEDIGTVWVLVNVTDDGARTNAYVFESFATDYLGLLVEDDNNIMGIYYGQGGAAQTISSSIDYITPGADTWIAYTWNEATDTHCVKISSGGTWRCATETLTNWTSEPNDITIGEQWVGATETDTIAIKEIYIYSTYQAGAP